MSDDHPAAGIDPVMCFELWRQDDNGNRVLVATFPTRAEAEAAQAAFEARAHKQIYWVDQAARTTAGSDASSSANGLKPASRPPSATIASARQACLPSLNSTA